MNKKASPSIEATEEAFGTAYAFALILFLSALLLGISLHTAGTMNSITKLGAAEEEIATQKTAEEIIHSLLEDGTPAADSPTDPVWERVAELNSETCSVVLEDISSKINPQFFRDEIIDATQLQKRIFTEGHTMAELEQYRNEKGWGISLKDSYPDFFSDDGLTSYLTSYSYLNLNIADELAIRYLYTIRTGNEYGAESFRQKIQQYRTRKTIICNNELSAVMTSAMKQLYPCMNSVPVMNVHYIHKDILREILSYDFGDKPLPHPDRAYNTIVQRRTSGEIEPSDLESIFSVKDENHIVYDYLGTKTWFWKISITSNGSQRELIVAELPDAESSYRPRDQTAVSITRPRSFQIIKNTFQHGTSKK